MDDTRIDFDVPEVIAAIVRGTNPIPKAEPGGTGNAEVGLG
jgi:hypothetical protein